MIMRITRGKLHPGTWSAFERAYKATVVAQGAEAGGHRSTFELGPDGQVPLVGTMALVPQVVDAVDVPVVAAGGISDGVASSPR